MADPKKESGNGSVISLCLLVGQRSTAEDLHCHPLYKHTQWHLPTANEALDPTTTKTRLQ